MHFKLFRHVLMAAMLAASLGACVTTLATLSPSAAYGLASTADIAIGAADTYIALPLCPTTAGTTVLSKVCHTTSGVKAIAPAMYDLMAKRKALVAWMIANPGVAVPITISNAVSAATSVLQQLISQYGG